MHLFIEPKESYQGNEHDVTIAIFEQLKQVEQNEVANLERLVNLRPLKVTLLKPGAFANYTKQRQKEGADLAHLKPPHINPKDKMLEALGVNIAEITPASKIGSEGSAKIQS